MSEKLTKKEEAFVKNFAANGGKVTKAALKAYDTDNYHRAAAIGSRNLKKPKIQEALEKELERQNITLPRALKPIANALKSPDIETQLKGSDRALKLLLPTQKSDLNLNLNIDSAHFGGEFVAEVKEENGQENN